METRTNQKADQVFRPTLNVKRDYYFHADEDFREDWEWGKSNPVQLETDGKKKSPPLTA